MDLYVAELFERVRGGDRAAAAEFFEKFRPLIRQRCRDRIRPSLRRITDSEDLWSTVVRRFDRLMAAGGLSLDTPRSFWSLVSAITEHAIVDRARVAARLARASSEDEPFAQSLRQRLAPGAADHPDEWAKDILDSFEDPVNRDILLLWLTERTHGQIGAAVGLSEPAVRWRWGAIRKQVKELVERSQR